MGKVNRAVTVWVVDRENLAVAHEFPVLSTKRVSTIRQTSINCCHSRLLRAKRETSRAATAPTLPRQTSDTMRSNPVRVTVPAADRPRSSSTTSISRHPSCRSRSCMAYCSFWLSGLWVTW